MKGFVEGKDNAGGAIHTFHGNDVPVLIILQEVVQNGGPGQREACT